MAPPRFEFPYGAQGPHRFSLEESFHCKFKQGGKRVDIKVVSTFSTTKSLVMRVKFMNSMEETKYGVLKLYDRRYPGGIRQTVTDMVPSVAADAAYRSLVCQGRMDLFLLALEHIYDTEPETCAKDFLHNQKFGGASFGSTEADSMARFEAAAWYECDKHFKTELKAYKQLDELQGGSIPRLYAHLRLQCKAVPQAAPGDQRWDRFLCVHGLLLEDIPGPTLKDWPALEPGRNKLKRVADCAAEAI